MIYIFWLVLNAVGAELFSQVIRDTLREMGLVP